MQDLNAQNTSFINSAKLWKVTNFNRDTIQTFKCENIFLLGGFSSLQPSQSTAQRVYFERTYSMLPSHTSIHFSVSVWILDNWDEESTFLLIKQDAKQTEWRFSNFNKITPNEVLNFVLKDQIHHNASSMTISFSSTLAQNKFFGIRDLNLTFSNDTITTEFPCVIGSEKSNYPKCSKSHEKSYSKIKINSCIPCENDSCDLIKDQRQINPSVPQTSTPSSIRILSEEDKPMFLLRAPERRSQFTIVKIVDLMRFIQYFDVPFPSRLQAVAKSKGRNLITLRTSIHMPEDLQERFADIPLPSAFQNRYLYSSFLVNFWENIIAILLVIGVILILLLMNFIFDVLMFETLKKITKALLIIAKWNFLIILWCSMIGDIIIFASLELRTFYKASDPDLTFVSFSASIIAVGFTLLFVGFIAYLIKKVYIFNTAAYEGRLHAEEEYKNFLKQWEGCQVLFSGLNDQYNYNQFFFLIYLSRLHFPLIFSALLIEYPITNTTIQLTINITIIIYIAILKPFKKKINHIQILLFESMVFIMSILVLVIILYNVDRAPDEDFDDNSLINALADIVIIGNDLINILMVVFLVIKFVLEYQAMKLNFRKNLSKSGTLWLQLLALPIQQGGFGFEEMIYDSQLIYPTIPDRNSSSKIYPNVKNPKVLKEVNQFARGEDEISQRSVTSRAELFAKPKPKPNQAVIDTHWKSQNASTKASILANSQNKDGVFQKVSNEQGSFDLMDLSLQDSPFFKPKKNKEADSPLIKEGGSLFQLDDSERSPEQKIINLKKVSREKDDESPTRPLSRLDRLHALKKNKLL